MSGRMTCGPELQLEDLWADCGRCLGALGQGALDSDRCSEVLVVTEAPGGGALVAVSAANLSDNYTFYYNKAYAIVTGDIQGLACPCHCARRDGAHHAP